MTVEGFEMVEGPVEIGVEEDKSISKENVKERSEEDAGVEKPIKFGSHVDEFAKAKENAVSDSNVPKNAVEEWPAPKQIHSFYFVRFRPYDDPNNKAKIDKLDKEISQKNQERIKVTDKLKAKRVSREYFCYCCLITFVLFLVKMGRCSCSLCQNHFQLCQVMSLCLVWHASSPRHSNNGFGYKII